MRALLRTVTALSLLVSLAGVSAPAHASPDWVSNVTWTNLNVKSEPGVFQRYRREFDDKSVLQTQSETQHNQAWIRTDRDSVTITYTGGKANANKAVRFVLDGDEAFSYSTTNSVIAAADTSNVPTNLDVVTDGAGNASVKLTLTEPNAANRADDVLRAGISNVATSAGNMVLLWEPAGYFPVVKLVGTGTGPEATCNTLHPFECNDSDLTEETWAWSVFKKDWLPEYSQVYVKSYLAGATIGLRYKVTDIWGTPVANLPLTLNLDSGCRLCKWDKAFIGTVNTDDNGYATFSLKNKNTTKEVLANTFMNADTKTKEHGFVAFALLPTTNELQESVDEFWPQLVSDINVKPAAVLVTTLKRGLLTADGGGNVVVGTGSNAVVNPALVIDEADNQLTDTNVINLNITYLKNSIPLALYAPDVKLSADNGGRFGLILPAHPESEYASVANSNSSYTFGYTYPQQIAVTCTKPGTTIFTIAIGTTKVTYPMDCVLPEHPASQIVGVASKTAQVGSANTATFQVTDRYGNGVSGIAVHVESAGNGSVAGQDFTTDETGSVSVGISASAAGVQTLTATASDANSTFTVNTTSSAINWAVVSATATGAKGSAKITVVNASGLSVTVLDGKKKVATFVAGSDNFAKNVKLAKGSHKLVVKAGKASFNLKVAVK